MKSYKDLIVWQKSIDLVEEIYTVTKGFPIDERFGLISQMRRCSVSISSNVAEGYGRQSKKDNAHFLSISLGSCLELQTQLIIAERLLYFEALETIDSLHSLLDEILRMLYAYRRSLQKNV